MSLESVTRGLSPTQTQVLKASARLDHRGATIKWVRGALKIGPHTVKTHNIDIFTKFNVYDMFSAVAYALNNGIIHLSDVVVSEEQLESIIDAIGNRELGNRKYFTKGEFDGLRDRYTYSLETGNSDMRQMAEREQTSYSSIRYRARTIFKNTPASNIAQSAVIGYIQDQLIKGEDVRKQYKASAQPAPG